MGTVTRGFIGMLSVVFFLGGVAMVTPLGSGVAQAAKVKHEDLDATIQSESTSIQNTVTTESTTVQTAVGAVESELTTQHDMIKQAITDTQTAIQGDLTTLQAAVDALEPGAAPPPCGAGTEGQRFVADPNEVCDNDTGLYWVKAPDSTTRLHANAVTHCARLDLGNSQTYRLPEVKELISLVDYSQLGPALPSGHPFSNVQSDRYWSATALALLPPVAWFVLFVNGGVDADIKTSTFFVWCARSGS